MYTRLKIDLMVDLNTFMHASMSTDGIAEDRRVNDLMSYAVYFEVIKALGSDSSIINELHGQPR